MLHYNPQLVSRGTLLIFRRTNCIITASGIVTLCKRPYSMPVESGLSTLSTGRVWIWWLVPFARQRPVPQRDNRQAVFGPMKSDCAQPPSVFAGFSTCWLLFVPRSEIPLEGASLWLISLHPESRDKYIKHNCKVRLLQRHPEAV
jgi:hypothetical protein